MGYSTNFFGAFAVTPTLKPEHAAYINQFADTRRMRREPILAGTLPDPVRIAARLPIGDEGGFFVGGNGFKGQDADPSVIDHNTAPKAQPGLWCQWVIGDTGTSIRWNGSEKFYNYIEWLQYLIDKFLGPWGYEVNGLVDWEGEEQGDVGTIAVVGNVIHVGNRIIT